MKREHWWVWGGLVAAALLVGACAGEPPKSREILMTEECVPPKRPPIPDGTRATHEQMQAARRIVQAYVTDAQTYLACVEDTERLLEEDADPARRAELAASHDRTVEDMHEAAERFNTQLRIYKDRESAEGP